MTLVIELPPDLDEKLRRLAVAAGKDATTFAREALEEKLRGPRTLDEILAPFRAQAAQSGMTDQEMDAFYEELRDEVCNEKRSLTA